MGEWLAVFLICWPVGEETACREALVSGDWEARETCNIFLPHTYDVLMLQMSRGGMEAASIFDARCLPDLTAPGS